MISRPEREGVKNFVTKYLLNLLLNSLTIDGRGEGGIEKPKTYNYEIFAKMSHIFLFFASLAENLIQKN